MCCWEGRRGEGGRLLLLYAYSITDDEKRHL